MVHNVHMNLRNVPLLPPYKIGVHEKMPSVEPTDCPKVDSLWDITWVNGLRNLRGNYRKVGRRLKKKETDCTFPSSKTAWILIVRRITCALDRIRSAKPWMKTLYNLNRALFTRLKRAIMTKRSDDSISWHWIYTDLSSDFANGWLRCISITINIQYIHI